MFPVQCILPSCTLLHVIHTVNISQLLKSIYSTSTLRPPHIGSDKVQSTAFPIFYCLQYNRAQPCQTNSVPHPPFYLIISGHSSVLFCLDMPSDWISLKVDISQTDVNSVEPSQVHHKQYQYTLYSPSTQIDNQQYILPSTS